MKPLFAPLYVAFPQKDRVLRESLYESIGHPEYVSDGRMYNTCGVRMSLALVACGVAIRPGNITVLAGKYKGYRLESGQARLSKYLQGLWGEPEKYNTGPAAKSGVGTRHGVISFFHLWNAEDRQGHIDLVSPDRWNEAACADDCYWTSTEVWFWPLR